MPLKRAQLAVLQASAKIFRTDRKRQLVLQPCWFGRSDGSKAELELELERATAGWLHRKCRQS
jgi:hypothetical protein